MKKPMLGFLALTLALWVMVGLRHTRSKRASQQDWNDRGQMDDRGIYIRLVETAPQ